MHNKDSRLIWESFLIERIRGKGKGKKSLTPIIPSITPGGVGRGSVPKMPKMPKMPPIARRAGWTAANWARIQKLHQKDPRKYPKPDPLKPPTEWGPRESPAGIHRGKDEWRTDPHRNKPEDVKNPADRVPPREPPAEPPSQGPPVTSSGSGDSGPRVTDVTKAEIKPGNQNIPHMRESKHLSMLSLDGAWNIDLRSSAFAHITGKLEVGDLLSFDLYKIKWRKKMSLVPSSPKDVVVVKVTSIENGLVKGREVSFGPSLRPRGKLTPAEMSKVLETHEGANRHMPKETLSSHFQQMMARREGREINWLERIRQGINIARKQSKEPYYGTKAAEGVPWYKPEVILSFIEAHIVGGTGGFGRPPGSHPNRFTRKEAELLQAEMVKEAEIWATIGRRLDTKENQGLSREEFDAAMIAQFPRETRLAIDAMNGPPGSWSPIPIGYYKGLQKVVERRNQEMGLENWADHWSVGIGSFKTSEGFPFPIQGKKSGPPESGPGTGPADPTK